MVGLEVVNMRFMDGHGIGEDGIIVNKVREIKGLMEFEPDFLIYGLEVLDLEGLLHKRYTCGHARSEIRPEATM